MKKSVHWKVRELAAEEMHRLRRVLWKIALVPEQAAVTRRPLYTFH